MYEGALKQSPDPKNHTAPGPRPRSEIRTGSATALTDYKRKAKVHVNVFKEEVTFIDNYFVAWKLSLPYLDLQQSGFELWTFCDASAVLTAPQPRPK